MKEEKKCNTYIMIYILSIQAHARKPFDELRNGIITIITRLFKLE